MNDGPHTGLQYSIVGPTNVTNNLISMSEFKWSKDLLISPSSRLAFAIGKIMATIPLLGKGGDLNFTGKFQMSHISLPLIEMGLDLGSYLTRSYRTCTTSWLLTIKFPTYGHTFTSKTRSNAPTIA